jgi:hypothetical protein
MPVKLYNRTNFHRHTFCLFQEVSDHEIQALVLNYRSKSGSEYYFTPAGVYRKSNHWGRAANCKWRLNPKEITAANRTKIGFADWASFYPDNEHDQLYFIQYNPISKQANYFHKDQGISIHNALVRTASETIKTLKIIRGLVDKPAWMDYIPNQNKQMLLQFVCEQLCTTSKSLLQIKAEARSQNL